MKLKIQHQQSEPFNKFNKFQLVYKTLADTGYFQSSGCPFKKNQRQKVKTEFINVSVSEQFSLPLLMPKSEGGKITLFDHAKRPIIFEHEDGCAVMTIYQITLLQQVINVYEDQILKRNEGNGIFTIYLKRPECPDNAATHFCYTVACQIISNKTMCDNLNGLLDAAYDQLESNEEAYKNFLQFMD